MAKKFEHLRRGDRGGRERNPSNDVYELARQYGIDDERVAVSLYSQAYQAQLPYEPGAVWRQYEQLLRQWSAPRPAPGKQTRTDALYGSPAPWEGPQPGVAPGKRTRTMALADEIAKRERYWQARQPADTADAPLHPAERLPGYNEVMAAMRALDDAIGRPAEDGHRADSNAGRGGSEGDVEPQPDASSAMTPAPAASEQAVEQPTRQPIQQADMLAAFGHVEALNAGDETTAETTPERHEADQTATAQPLPAATRTRMERAFAHDFSDVTVYADSPDAAGTTRALTRGRDIHFRRDAYAPGTPGGDRLIAHELAHVVQQTNTAGQTGERKAVEADADRAATAALLGQKANVQMRAPQGAAYAYSDAEDHDSADGLQSDEAAAERSDDSQSGPSDETSASDTQQEAPGTAPDDQDESQTDADDLRGELDALAGETVAADDSGGSGGAGSGGGTGAGSAIAAGTAAPPPDMAGVAPESAFGQLQGLRPDNVAHALGGVSASISQDISQSRQQLAANPPQQMSTGEPTGASMPRGGSGTAGANAKVEADPPSAAGADTASAAAQSAQLDEGQSQGSPALSADQDPGVQHQQALTATQQQTAGQLVEGVVNSISAWFSSWIGGAGDKNSPDAMSESQMQEMSADLDRLPTDGSRGPTSWAESGRAPEIDASSQAQANATRDREALNQSISRAETQAATDMRAPMGENSIETSVPTEPLSAQPIPAGESVSAELPALDALATTEEIGIIAQQEKQDEIDAAAAQAQSEVAAERGAHAAADAEARSQADRDMADLKAGADADQAAAKAQAKEQVQAARSEWQSEIRTQSSEARQKADKKVQDGLKEVQNQQDQANREAQNHIDEGQQRAEEEQRKGQKEAEEAKKKGKEKSSGFLGWVASKAKAFFDGIKKAVSAAIEAAKKAVKAVISAAKKLADAVIEAARAAIVATIKAIGKALTAIGDVLLAAFPALRAKFRQAIQGLVDKAVAAVNKLAEGLKKAIQKALDVLGSALDAALGLLEKGLHAIVDAYSAVVQGVIKAAQAIADALGPWLKLVSHIASAPLAWLGKLGRAAMDGIKNHLWNAFKTAVLAWFQSKVMELLGIGGLVLQLLFAGGITIENITQMALQALMVAIPAALIAILIEKLVSMIIPAAGAVLAIIEGLQAAWGTISRIIAAFSAFMAFLLAVQGGSAGTLFAAALAAAAVVVLDFVSNWLLRKLRKPAAKVGNKLKGMAQKFKGRRGRGSGKANVGKNQGAGAKRTGAAGKQKGTGKKPDKRQQGDRRRAQHAATKAAQSGWRKASSAVKRRVRQPADVAQILRQVRGTGGTRTRVSAKQSGKSWQVHATATVGNGRATANAGRGSVLHDPQGRPWFASQSLGGLSRQLIREASQRLTAKGSSDSKGDARKSYDAKKRLARTIERDATSKLAKRARGVNLKIAMESFAGVEKDNLIKTRITVAPNTESHELQVPVVGDPDFQDLENKLKAEVVGKSYQLPDRVVLAARRAARKVGFKKADWNRTTNAAGDYEHTLVFHHPSEPKTQAWAVAKVAGDDHCPACGSPITDTKSHLNHPDEDTRDASRPHFFLPESKLRAAITTAVGAVKVHYMSATDAPKFAVFETWIAIRSNQKRLVGPRTPAAISGRRNSLDTQRDEQMQCRQCEDLAAHKHGTYTLLERQQRAKTGAVTGDKDAHVGNQVGGSDLTKRDAQDLTSQRLHLRVYPHVQAQLQGVWPTGMSRFDGDRTRQIAEFIRALNSATKVYR